MDTKNLGGMILVLSVFGVVLVGCSNENSSATAIPSITQLVPQGKNVALSEADYESFGSLNELIGQADTVVSGVVVGARQDDLYPDKPSTNDPALSPQYGVSAEDFAKIPPIVTTVVTVRVNKVFKSRFPVGTEIEVRYLGGKKNGVIFADANTPPIESLSGEKMLFLKTAYSDKPSSILNPIQSILTVTKDGALLPIVSENKISPDSEKELRTQIDSEAY